MEMKASFIYHKYSEQVKCPKGPAKLTLATHQEFDKLPGITDCQTVQKQSVTESTGHSTVGPPYLQAWH